MEATDEWGTLNNCKCGGGGAAPSGGKEALKPLERRKLRHQRCLAHSLVGTPNYIAPEVLQRTGQFYPLSVTCIEGLLRAEN